MARRSRVVYDQLADLARLHRLHGHGVQHFQQKGVFPKVQAVFFGALHGYTRPVDLAEAVAVKGLDPEQLLQPLAGLLAVGLGPDDGELELGVAARVQALLGEDPGQAQGVAGDEMHGRGAELAHERYLAAAVAGAHGDDHGPQALRPWCMPRPPEKRP